MAKFNTPHDGSRGFKAGSDIFINAEPQISNDETIQGLREDIFVELLRSNNNIGGLRTLDRLLRDYSIKNGFENKCHPESHKLMWGIANCFSERRKDIKYALLWLRSMQSDMEFVTASQTSSKFFPNSNVVDYTMNKQKGNRKIANNLSHCFLGKKKNSIESLAKYLRIHW